MTVQFTDFTRCCGTGIPLIPVRITLRTRDDTLLQTSHEAATWGKPNTDTILGFIAKSWRITSKGMFAGSCIGVILLVIALEALRRAGKEYDRYIVAQHLASINSTTSDGSSAASGNSKTPVTTTRCTPTVQNFRPSVVQQAIRSLLHMLQFAVAYFVMLLAMYYNGYIIICIFIGAYIGYFLCGWETLSVGKGGQDRMQENATVCCG